MLVATHEAPVRQPLGDGLRGVHAEAFAQLLRAAVDDTEHQQGAQESEDTDEREADGHRRRGHLPVRRGGHLQVAISTTEDCAPGHRLVPGVDLHVPVRLRVHGVEVKQRLGRLVRGRQHMRHVGGGGEAQHHVGANFVLHDKERHTVVVESDLLVHSLREGVEVELIDELLAIRVDLPLGNPIFLHVLERIVQVRDPAGWQAPEVRVCFERDVGDSVHEVPVARPATMIVDPDEDEAILRVRRLLRHAAALGSNRQAVDAALATLAVGVVAVEAGHAATTASLALRRLRARAARVAGAEGQCVDAPWGHAVVAGARAVILVRTSLDALHAGHALCLAGLEALGFAGLLGLRLDVGADHPGGVHEALLETPSRGRLRLKAPGP
mmetsp:Transcript_53621/g.117012  ORF Transcript_53621/g.117012 Transcript_53621/m.117012 type:complete len:383 (-) Transcript_53621:1177-2325(-)